MLCRTAGREADADDLRDRGRYGLDSGAHEFPMTAPADTNRLATWRDRLRPHSTTSGMLFALLSAPFGVVQEVHGPWWQQPTWLQVAGALTTVLLLGGAVGITRVTVLARGSATLGLLGLLALGAPLWGTSPLYALMVLIVSTVCLMLLWKVGAPLIELSRLRRRPVHEGQAQGAAVVALAMWLLWAFTQMQHGVEEALVVGWPLSLSALTTLEWSLRRRHKHRTRSRILWGALVVAAALALLLRQGAWWALSAFAIPAALAAVLIRSEAPRSFGESSLWDALWGHPERLFVGTYAGLALSGTVLLALPQSAADGVSIGFVDALFTATSAVCVNGLTVLDTSRDFSAFGQVIILLLVQVGGLGIMTFSTALLGILGRRMSLSHEGAVARLISSEDRGHLFSSVGRILRMTLAFEGVGAAVLTLLFLAQGEGFAQALWRGVFTAISAFCNAGFALQSDSLVSFQNSPLVLHTVGVLIIAGSLSPLVIFSLPAILGRTAKPVPAQARLAWVTAVGLTVVGFLGVLAIEWGAALGGLGGLDKLHNAWLQSVTLRSAGFNSIETGGLRGATIVLMVVMMFIGGSPGSTAGGIKTTTFAVLVLSVVRAMRGQWSLEVFGRSIPERTRAKAIVVVSIALTFVFVAVSSLMLTQKLPERMMVFEVVSALGTTGLSMGLTPQLDGIGRGIIIVCMFVGRVGGLTLLMFLKGRHAPATLGRPEEAIDVG